MNNFNVTCI